MDKVAVVVDGKFVPVITTMPACPKMNCLGVILVTVGGSCALTIPMLKTTNVNRIAPSIVFRADD